MYFFYSYTSLLSSDTLVQDELQFKKTMPMFSDEGASPYEFTATYEDRFSHKNKQSGYPADMDMILEVESCCLLHLSKPHSCHHADTL